MHKDIFPTTPIARLGKPGKGKTGLYDIGLISSLVGMSPTYIKKALGVRKGAITISEVYDLLDLDAFSETFVPRSKIPEYLTKLNSKAKGELNEWWSKDGNTLYVGSALDLLPLIEDKSIQCVVTSTPYWGTRIYEKSIDVEWADGEICPYGHEQTPEGFIRHSVEMLFLIKPLMKETGSVWWNIMDTYNTRTQIRSNAAETMKAMQGKDKRGWKDHPARRYSAGHSFLKDGEQCLIPERISERAARLGYWVKSNITWKKNGSMPETVTSRVTREMEKIIHLSVHRTPYLKKERYLELPPKLGGRSKNEAEKITDVWTLSTTSGRDGHGAQFPLALPGRCIALSTKPGDIVLDPFIGGGTTSLAAMALDRKCIGIDINDTYLKIARKKIETSK